MIWRYQIKDKDHNTVLKEHKGFKTKEDAQVQAQMEANLYNIKNYHIEVEEICD